MSSNMIKHAFKKKYNQNKLIPEKRVIIFYKNLSIISLKIKYINFSKNIK